MATFKNVRYLGMTVSRNYFVGVFYHSKNHFISVSPNNDPPE